MIHLVCVVEYANDLLGVIDGFYSVSSRQTRICTLRKKKLRFLIFSSKPQYIKIVDDFFVGVVIPNRQKH